MENTQQTKLAAIVFTDIVGYTQKMDSDEMLTMSFLERQREIIYPIVKEYEGRVLKEIGDGLLIMFDSALQAVRCTIEIQTQLKDEAFKIRAGVHMGDVIMTKNDVFGAAVNIAARIEPQAAPGGIAVSGVVSNQIQNKLDIKTISLGVRDLKGVKAPVEIFEVSFGDSSQKKIEITSFIKHLWQRRVPHISAIYGLLVLFIYFVLAYISTNYFLSPHLVQFGTVLLLSLFPSVLIISYFHGRAASGEWKKIERFGLPINLIISAVFLFSLFNDKDLGAKVKDVNVVDENGQVIEREVLKGEFRKSLAIFFFKNETKDAELDYLKYAIPFMLGHDLLQDVFIRTETSYNFYKRILDENYNSEMSLPLTVKEKIASQRQLNNIVEGSINKNADGKIVINLSVRNTKTSQLISENNYIVDNIFKTIDEISVQLKQDIGIPERHITEVKDLPVNEMLTNSTKALKSFIASLNSVIFENDYKTAEKYSKDAVSEDPMFVNANVQLVNIYVSTSQQALLKETFNKVMQNLDRLPEQVQFMMKYIYYLLVKQEPDKSFAVVKMWKELYPFDIEAYMLMASIYELKNEPKNAIAEYEAILQLDPERYDCYLNIARMYEQQSKYDNALESYQQYVKFSPESTQPYLSIAGIYLSNRSLDLAKLNYEKVLLIDHDNISASVGLANILFIKGEFNKLEDLYNELLALCRTPQDKNMVYKELVDYYVLTGQITKAIESMDKAYVEFAKYTEPINVIINQAIEINNYVLAGKTDKAFKILQEYESQLSPPLDKFISLGYMFLYLELDDVENIEKTIVGVEDVINTFNYQILTSFVINAQAKLLHLKGDYEGSIKILKNFLKENPSRMSLNKVIAYCYRKLKDYDKAVEHLQKVLDRNPFDPDYNYEMAMIYADKGDAEKAKEYLKVALDVWKDAEPVYKPAQEAMEKYLELTQ